MDSLLSDEQIGQILQSHRPDLAGGAISWEPILTGKFNSSYLLEAAGERLVLRLAPPRDAVYVFYERQMMRQEPELHALLRAQTEIPVPEVFGFDNSLTLVERDYILMSWLPGRPLTEMGQVDFDHVLRQIGRYLRQAHALRGEQYGYVGAHRPMEPQGSWVEAFEVMWQKLVDDVAAVGYYDEEERAFLLTLFAQYRSFFDRPLAASLLHMDVWHQNILVDAQGTVTGLLDWDRALWGDPEIEFAVLDYCGLSEAAFWEGYGRARDDSAEARIRQVFYLLYELQKYIVIYHGRNHEPQRAAEKKEQVVRLVRQVFTE